MGIFRPTALKNRVTEITPEFFEGLGEVQAPAAGCGQHPVNLHLPYSYAGRGGVGAGHGGGRFPDDHYFQ